MTGLELLIGLALAHEARLGTMPVARPQVEMADLIVCLRDFTGVQSA